MRSVHNSLITKHRQLSAVDGQTVLSSGVSTLHLFLVLGEIRLSGPVHEVLNTEHQRSVRRVEASSGLAQIQPLAALRQDLPSQQILIVLIQRQLLMLDVPSAKYRTTKASCHHRP